GQTFEVIFGETKRLAIARGVKDGRLPADFPIKIEVDDIDDETAQVRALAENMARNTMTDVDISGAVHKLSAGMKAANVMRQLGLSKRQ
ncbi:hypothetical protein, partial [Acinetobacter baumannii]|uniref:hypothetical protein n=1 Tax=Acinetobacter baumannii TaxID=470 RepID=UPI0013D45EF2